MKEKGITLIALIITIIVMLILSAVVINLTIGKNGIFVVAKNAVEQQKMAETREKIALAILNLQAEKTTRNEEFSIDVIIKELPSKIKDLTIQKEGDKEAKGTCDGYNYKIDKDYNVTIEGLKENTGGNSQSGKEEKILVTKITLNKETAEIEIGKTILISATVEPDNATNKNVKWNSSDESIATVNDDGIVTGIKAGNVIITATASDGSGVTKNCSVTVNTPAPVALASVVNIGDYVAYDPTVGVSSENQSKLKYTSPKGTGTSHGNGSEEAVFKALPNSQMKWRVLRKDTTTGEVVLISENLPNVYFQIYGVIGYLYGEMELRSSCAVYGYGFGADTSKTFSYNIGTVEEGMKYGSISGSGATSMDMKEFNKVTGYVGEATYKKSFPHNIYYPSMKTETGWSSSTKYYSSYKSTDWWYNVDDYLNNESNEYKVLFKSGDETWNLIYYLCDRFMDPETYNSETAGAVEYEFASTSQFNIGLSAVCICRGWYNKTDNHPGGSSSERGLRPIVYLKSTLKTEGKNADGAWTITE